VTPAEADAAVRRARRDLRGLVALERVQIGIAIVLLAAIAVRSRVSAVDTRAAFAISGIVMLALAYLALAVRVRMGQGMLRRELYALELRREPRPPAHPYRSRALE
jgi:hypothetical protein